MLDRPRELVQVTDSIVYVAKNVEHRFHWFEEQLTAFAFFDSVEYLNKKMKELIIDLKEANNKEELHNLLSFKLGFPDWYGKNWDACWDLITDTELVRMPDKLMFVGFERLLEKLPMDAQLLQQCFFDMKESYPSIACEVIFS